MPAPDGTSDLIPYIAPAAGGRGVSVQRTRLPVTEHDVVERPCLCGAGGRCLPRQVAICAECGAAARRAILDEIGL